MVSFKQVLAHAWRCAESEQPETFTPSRRQRREWIRGEVRCLMCARLVGRLLGSRDGAVSVGRPSCVFFAYRSAAMNSPVVRYLPGVHFRCETCGGAGAVDDLESFFTSEARAGAALPKAS
jgi:hypothetical protein